MKMQIVSQAISLGRKFVRENPDKVQSATRKAGDFVNKKTNGKYSDKIVKAEAAADKYISKQAGSPTIDSTPATPSTQTQPTTSGANASPSAQGQTSQQTSPSANTPN